MKKKVLVLLILFLLVITSCSKKINQNDNIKRYYLEEKYYNKGKFVSVSSNELENIKQESFLLYIYNNFCNMAIPCENIFEEFMDKYDIDIVSIPFTDFKETSLYNSVRYAPSIIVIEKGKVLDYLDANSDDDLLKYQDVSELEKWLNNYVYFTKKK